MGEEVKNLNTANGNEKLSYEQLENICHQLSEQSRELYTRLQEANMANMFTRLNFLFKMLEQQVFFEEELIDAVANEIKQLMAVGENHEEVEAVEENKE